MPQTRRHFLRSTAATTGALTGLAGCTGGGTGGGDTGGDTGGDGMGGPTATDTPSPTDTPTSTEGGMDGNATVTVDSHPIYGEVLADAEGRALYLFTPDTDGESTCYDGCAQNWPPLTTDGEPEAGSGVTASLGTTERDDGSTQVTAGGWPLYYFAGDSSPDDAAGQELGNVWFLLRPDGSGIFPTVSVREHEEHGPILTDADGMTLYLFTNDEGSTSSCYDSCAENWPPLLVGDRGLVESVMTDVELGTSERDDGSTMVTAAGYPLYYFANDEEPGDATGQGVSDVWYVLDAEGNPVDGQDSSTEGGGPY